MAKPLAMQLIQRFSLCAIRDAIGLFIVTIIPCRVQAYIKNGWADALIDPNGTITGTDISSSNPTNDDAIFPKDLSWNNIKTYYK